MAGSSRCRACRIGASIIISLLPCSAAAQEPVAKQITPIVDALVTSFQVTGGLLAGLSAETGTPSTPPRFPLAVYLQTSKPAHICVKVITADGRYDSGEVEYELPAVPQFTRIRLPYEGARHFDFIARQLTSDIAVLARTGSCSAHDGAPLIAAWNPGSARPSRLVFAVITGGLDTTLQIGDGAGNWDSARECEAVQRQGGRFGARCTAATPPGDGNFRVRIQRYTALGTRLKPEEFEVVRTTGAR
jgi:hypothetical protein